MVDTAARASEHRRGIYLKGDDLASKRRLYPNCAYERLPALAGHRRRRWKSTNPGGAPITGFLHMPKGDGHVAEDRRRRRRARDGRPAAPAVVTALRCDY
ncbi:alpha/beta hydrolase [Escherichia coli]